MNGFVGLFPPMFLNKMVFTYVTCSTLKMTDVLFNLWFFVSVHLAICNLFNLLYYDQKAVSFLQLRLWLS